jgi:hypothetical protein
LTGFTATRTLQGFGLIGGKLLKKARDHLVDLFEEVSELDTDPGALSGDGAAQRASRSAISVSAAGSPRSARCNVPRGSLGFTWAFAANHASAHAR